jgi:two-component system response regulator QseB
MHILVIEDDPRLADLLQQLLTGDRHVVDVAANGRDGLDLAADGVDAIVLDIGLPDISGLDVARRIRRRGSTVPILMLTARDAVADKVHGLDAGADDYLVKPFELTELAARIRALVRRQSGRAAPRIDLGAVTIDPATREVCVGGSPVALSGREYALLEALAARPGAILSRAQLEERLYGWKDAVDSNAVEVHLSSLRRKLPPDTIRNVRGLGWMLPRPSTATV